MKNVAIDLKTSNLALSASFLWLFAAYAFCSMNPFYIWGYYQYAFASLMFSCIAVYIVGKGSRLSWIFLLCFLLLLVLNSLRGMSILGAIIFSLSVSFLLLQSELTIKKVYDRFLLLYTCLLIPGILIWICHWLSGDNDFLRFENIPSDIIPNQLKVASGMGYAKYPFMVVLDYTLQDPVYRFMGPFDEPGVVGTISVLILVVEKFNLKSKRNVVVLIAGLISFSLAFYVLTVAYLLLVCLRNKPSRIYVSALLLGSFWFASSSEIISGKTLDRLQIDNGIFGNNRVQSELLIAMSNWSNGTVETLLFGLPGPMVADGSSSFLSTLVYTGILGVFVYVMIIAIFILRLRSHVTFDFIVFIAFFLAAGYQRPDNLKPEFMLLFLCAGVVSSTSWTCCSSSSGRAERGRISVRGGLRVC
jgi:hypothetical protein